eukprot:TRINITY_DN15231_c0_g1_i1.p1 TRINITY_DN15231_c0_g1~~TRINITY_DN15231_c0_g1_i1.p1  ORF type:complete len:120 (+),score=9.34 TRINITY_DN15231_c0_g1_i1:199-558(+)
MAGDGQMPLIPQNVSCPMDPLIDKMEATYDAVLSSAAAILEGKDECRSGRPSRRASALDEFLSSLKAFQGACDQTQEMVESLRQRLIAGPLVEEIKVGPATEGGAPAQEDPSHHIQQIA